MSLKNKYIEDLIKQGENQQLDFKFEIADSKKIARTLSAFSNTDGGTLLIGVKDNGSITGVNSTEEYHMLEAAANMYCKPEVSFKAKEWNIDGKKVLEFIIPKDPYIPYLAPDHKGIYKAYIRVQDQNILANYILLEVWKAKKNKVEVIIKYTKDYQTLFECLKKHDQISLTSLCKHTSLTKTKAKKMLIKLILLNQIRVIFKESEVHYSLKN